MKKRKTNRRKHLKKPDVTLEYGFLFYLDRLIEHMDAIEEVVEKFFIKDKGDFEKESKQFTKKLDQYTKQLERMKKEVLGIAKIKTPLTQHVKKKQYKIDYEIRHMARAIRHTGRGIRKRRDAVRMVSQNLLVMAVSKYDLFLTSILQQFFICRPDNIRSFNRTVSIAKVMDLKTSKKIIESEVEKEVNGILRDSHLKQIEYIEDKTNVEILPHLKILPEFVELTERRNLFVHNDGVVNENYIGICKKIRH